MPNDKLSKQQADELWEQALKRINREMAQELSPPLDASSTTTGGSASPSEIDEPPATKSKRKKPRSRSTREPQLLSGVSMSDFRSAANKLRAEMLEKARKAASPSTSPEDPADPNRPETEEDGIKAEALRRFRAHQLALRSVVRRDQTQPSSPSQSDTPPTTVSPSGDKPSS